LAAFHFLLISPLRATNNTFLLAGGGRAVNQLLIGQSAIEANAVAVGRSVVVVATKIEIEIGKQLQLIEIDNRNDRLKLQLSN
jgi:hypothetical protein